MSERVTSLCKMIMDPKGLLHCLLYEYVVLVAAALGWDEKRQAGNVAALHINSHSLSHSSSSLIFYAHLNKYRRAKATCTPHVAAFLLELKSTHTNTAIITSRVDDDRRTVVAAHHFFW